MSPSAIIQYFSMGKRYGPAGGLVGHRDIVGLTNTCFLKIQGFSPTIISGLEQMLEFTLCVRRDHLPRVTPKKGVKPVCKTLKIKQKTVRSLIAPLTDPTKSANKAGTQIKKTTKLPERYYCSGSLFISRTLVLNTTSRAIGHGI